MGQSKRMFRVGIMSFFVIFFLIFGIAYAAYLPFMDSEAAWMEKVQQPALILPGWICGIAWAGVYLLMTVAVWFVLQEKDQQDVLPALGVFMLQFCVNILWGPVIVRSQNLNWAMIYLCVLFVLVILNMTVFWGISETAGKLFVPYLLWVAYTLCVQTVVWQKNV